MSIVSFNEAKSKLSVAIREETYSAARDEREITWRDPDTHEVIAEGCCTRDGSEVNFNLEEGIAFFDGRQGETLVELGDDSASASDFIDTSVFADTLFAPPQAASRVSRKRF